MLKQYCRVPKPGRVAKLAKCCRMPPLRVCKLHLNYQIRHVVTARSVDVRYAYAYAYGTA